MESFRNGSLLVVKAKEEPRASSAAQYEKWAAADDFYAIPFEGVSLPPPPRPGRGSPCRPGWAVMRGSSGKAGHRHSAAAACSVLLPRWVIAARPARLPVQNYEPYVIVNRTLLPWYDEQYRAHAFDKVGGGSGCLLPATAQRCATLQAFPCRVANSNAV